MESKESNRIRVKVMCVIMDGDRVLAGKGRDNVKGEDFYRVLGGSMQFGETSEEGIRREIREELNSEIDDLKFLDIVEDRYEFDAEWVSRKDVQAGTVRRYPEYDYSKAFR